MKILITLIFSGLLSNYITAQRNEVTVDFEVDGKKVANTRATVKFIYQSNTVDASIKDGKLVIPDAVFNKHSIVTFYVNNYVFVFDSIPVTLNSLNPKWIVGVDKKPFDKKKFWTIKSWKKVQIVYYLNNADGRMFTVDGSRKSEVIRN